MKDQLSQILCCQLKEAYRQRNAAKILVDDYSKEIDRLAKDIEIKKEMLAEFCGEKYPEEFYDQANS